MIVPPEKTSFSADADAQAISPDGRQIAFVASGSNGTPLLWIRRLDSLNARRLAGTGWRRPAVLVSGQPVGRLLRSEAS